VVQGIREDNDIEGVVAEGESLARGIDVPIGMVGVGLQSSSEHLSTAIGSDGACPMTAQPSDQCAVTATHIQDIPASHIDGFREDIGATAKGHAARLGHVNEWDSRLPRHLAS